MRIKRLEVVGFKSFCDRTVLHFNQPITSVVGPNGCGKSNIVDAIRWCMGEQSAKHLRGKAMEDVIFAGSDTRGPLGMCEVTLVFENDGNVPVEFLAYSEIAVTRKLYRDGTSEYYLNKTPCRLRDITDFFLGTGIGAKAYSIIEQGRVGMIVSSRPEDRRLLIEEAAGITKYKVKKKAAEKKMESTRQNLLRVSDVTAELEKQLASLRRQAQKAERYKAYKAELRDLDLWAASQKWLGFVASEQVAAHEGAALTEEASELQTRLAADDALLASERLQLVEEEDVLNGKQQTVYELDNRIRLNEAEAEHEERRARELVNRAESERREVASLEAQLASLDVQRQETERELEELLAATGGESDLVAQQEEVVQVCKSRLAALAAGTESVRARIANCKADVARLEQSERAAVRRRDDLELRVGRLAEEQQRTDVRLAEVQAELDAIEAALAGRETSKQQLSDERSTLQARLDELKPMLEARSRRLHELQPELHKRQSRRHSLEEIAQKYEGFANGTRKIMQAKEGRWGLRGILAEVVEAPAELEAAVEAVLGDRLGAVVVSSQEAGLDGIDFLKRDKGGRATFLPLNRFTGEGVTKGDLPDDSGCKGWLRDKLKADDECDGLLDQIFAGVVLVDDLITAVDLWRAGHRYTYVTLEGDLLSADGATTGGTRDVAGAGLLEQKREIRELETIIAQLEAEVAIERDAQETLEAERNEIVIRLDAVRRELHEAEIELVTRGKDRTRHVEEIERHRHRQGSIGRDHADLAAQLDEARREGEEAQLQLRASRDAMVALEDELTAGSRDQIGAMEELERAQEELTVLRVRAGQVQEKRGGLERTLARMIHEHDDKEQRRARLVESAAAAEQESGELAGVASARREELLRLLSEKSAASEELLVGRRLYEEKRAALTAREGELRVVRQALEDRQKRLQRNEILRHDLSSGRRHLEESIFERYRVELAVETQAHHLRPLVTAVEEERARELGDLISRMGEINLNAIEEYNELDQRYTFLCTQKSDLEQALAQLEEAIARINETSRQRFREVFDLVNERFQELFPRCFRGGQARLVLTDEENLLESGIEIIAQPPGKKNATVEMLSGGEKAMTAVALIFAIFLIKPSPFCLLDEVDAPLDEANVGRYNDLIRELTDRSQFIVITHNKRTMQIADTLYGVTMEEPGCSKLVSVNLSALGEDTNGEKKKQQAA